MRHRKSGRKLKRTSSHRKGTLSALSTALLRHKKIKTTVAKAKETRMVVEKIITRAKNAVAAEGDTKDVHARREVARYIKDREVVTELFSEIAKTVASRPGGYTRVVKLGQRHGVVRPSLPLRAPRAHWQVQVVGWIQHQAQSRLQTHAILPVQKRSKSRWLSAARSRQ